MPASWELARSLATLRSQVNTLVPGRDKSSDGTVGDESHKSRSSDHNAWLTLRGVPIVHALDITHDVPGGFDSYAFAEMLRKAQDDRIKYVISNYRIFSGTGQDKPAWVWRPYPVPPNKNPHDHHVHISTKDDPAHFDDPRQWVIGPMPVITPQPIEAREPRKPVLKVGSVGTEVANLQRKLGIDADGKFGDKTKAAVQRFQDAHGIVADGIVGPQTWKALGG